MSKAVMIGITYHSADPADVNHALVLVTFRFLGTGQDLGTLDAQLTVTETDNPATITTKIQNAVVARAAEYGVTLTADDLVPLTYGVPQSLMSPENFATMTINDTGTDIYLTGSLGQTRALSPWWFENRVGIGTPAASPIGLDVFERSSGPVGIRIIAEATDGVQAYGTTAIAQSQPEASSVGQLVASQSRTVFKGTGKTFTTPGTGFVANMEGQGTDATSTLAKYRAFAAIDPGYGDPLTVTDWIGFEEEEQTHYGTNRWGVKTFNKIQTTASDVIASGSSKGFIGEYSDQAGRYFRLRAIYNTGVPLLAIDDVGTALPTT